MCFFSVMNSAITEFNNEIIELSSSSPVII